MWPSDVMLEEWRSLSGLELASTRPPPSTEAQQRFEYNASEAPLFIDLAGQYLGADSTIYDGSITLAPSTSAILIANGPVTGIDAGVEADAGASDGGSDSGSVAGDAASSDGSTINSDSGAGAMLDAPLAGGCNCDAAPNSSRARGGALWTDAFLLVLRLGWRTRNAKRV